MAKEKKKPEKSAEETAKAAKKAVKEKENIDEKATVDINKNVSEEKSAEPAEKTAGENQAEEKDAKTEELSKKIDELNNALLRTAAEYDNFRKRTVKEKEMIYSDSKTDIISKLLPVIDNFERASAAGSDLDSYKRGIEMTVKQLFEALTSLGVETFGEAGEVFDPNIHNCVMHIEDESLGENIIVEVFVKGYKSGERIIRYASVKVAN